MGNFLASCSFGAIDFLINSFVRSISISPFHLHELHVRDAEANKSNADEAAASMNPSSQSSHTLYAVTFL
jgi:hypothetical protein